MRKIYTLSVLIFFINDLYAQQNRLIKYVDPMVGTAASTTASALKHGMGGEQFANTIPAVGTPFGMTQWTPQTNAGEQKCVTPYYYKSNNINGFRATHWISGSCMQDYGSVTIMPVTGKLITTEDKYRTGFSHADEVSAPDYYRVKLPAYKLDVEMTAAPRCGILRITAQTNDSLYLLITPNSNRGKGYIKIDNKTGQVSGYNPAYRLYQGSGKPAGFSGYFAMQISKAFSRSGTFAGDSILSGNVISNRKNIGAYAGFKVNKGEQLIIKVGTSFTSIEEARNNLATETNHKDFNTIRQRCARLWESKLKKIKVTGTQKNKQIFYTALYHTMQLPRLFNDVSGTYPRFAGQYQTARLHHGNYYDDFSMWDIYRAQLPLYQLLDPLLVNDMVSSILSKGKQGGWLPIFPCWNNYTNEMVGDHSTVFIASAYLKGIKNYDVKEAYRLMRQNAFDTPADSDYVDGKGRRALKSYLKYGYIPLEDPVKEAFHQNEQVSRTLEYAYDDYALAMFAKVTGHKGDYEKLIKRSSNYTNVFDASVGFARGRYADGSWISDFDPDKKVSYITEGTPRQYTFYIPQNVPGIARLLGSKDKLETALDSLFTKGEYWHGNEPGHQIPFMYNYTNSPWKTQQAVRDILADEYTNGPGGLSGNDDAGQISAWYIFGAMGLYPVDPVSGNYQLSSPIFDDIQITLPNGKNIHIQTIKTSGDKFIHSVKWNQTLINNYSVSHTNLLNGGTLNFILTNKH